MSDKNNPFFVLFPINNNRTGYKPYAMPVVYVERNRVNSDGSSVADSESISLTYYVEDAPDPAKVAGPFNQNIRIPSQALFEVDVSALDLAARQIDLRALTFYDSDSNQKTYFDAVEGDTFQYTLKGTEYTFGSNPTDQVVYYPDAYYYDLSDITIQVEELPILKTYSFIWQATYFRRIDSVSGDFKCLSADTAITAKVLQIKHPGDVHEFMFRSTPSLYFDYQNFKKSTDKTLEFYRPFADLLQDIFDEQEFLDGINQIDSIPAEYIPYLAFLIGWDLPNYPGSTDQLRRKILKQAVYLQKLKGSKRAINELFELFGFVIDLVNLHTNLEGNKYLAPDDGLDTEVQMQTDVVLSSYKAQGFGVGEVPFTYRPIRDSQVVLYAWQVKNDSLAFNSLKAVSDKLANDLESENTSPVLNEYGLLEPSFVKSIGESGNGIIGFSTVEVGVSSRSIGRTVLNSNNISYDSTTNLLSLYFDHELSVDKDSQVFVYGVYNKQKIFIPDSLSNTRTNKFDVEIIDKDGLIVDFNLLEFLLDFLFKIKAFHSLLRKIKITSRLNEVYNVIDMCVDGKDPYAPGTPLGDLQSSPAIIPMDLSGCQEDSDRGFKQSDLFLRNLILGGLEEEFQTWKALSSSDCAQTSDGQDKVKDDGCLDELTLEDCKDYDHEPDNRKTLCKEDPSQPDYCYKGRVKDSFQQKLVLTLKDRYKCQPCGPSLGDGVYWEQNGPLSSVNIAPLSLHYSVDSYLSDKSLNSDKTKVTNYFNLNIEKDNLGFPSHRFITMFQLKNDYNYTKQAIASGRSRDYSRKRPWDDTPICGTYDDLNAQLIEKTNGDQQLIWDDENLIYEGNGLLPDIPSLDDHCTDPTDDKVVTHKLYQYAEPSHPSLTFENTDFIQTEFIDTDTLPTGSIFQSTCEVDNSDFVGGYPSSFDCVSATATTFEDGDTTTDIYKFCSEGNNPTCEYGYLDRSAIAATLAIPSAGSSPRDDARYFGNSMIYINNNNPEYKYYVPYRLDCECYNDTCDITNSITDGQETSCNAAYITDSNGNLDVGCDKINMDLAVSLQETMCLCSRITDNDLPSLFCLNKSCSIPDEGHFVYKDSYNIIYEVEWVIAEDTMDISVVTKDPRIPGVEPDGYVINSQSGTRIFRKGIITIIRKIIKFTADSYYIDAEGSEISVDYYQENTVCNEEPFDNPFSYDINCAIKDAVEMLYTDGPSWQSYDDPTASEYVWASSDSTAGTENADDLIWT